MAKYNIDDILNELGVDGGVAGTKGKAKLTEPAGKQHRIDQAESTFSPLPAMPANQRSFGQGAISPVSDPAVKDPIKSSSEPSVGPAVSDIYSPDAGGGGDRSEGLGELLLSKTVINAERLTSALAGGQVVEPAPWRTCWSSKRAWTRPRCRRPWPSFRGSAFERVDLAKGLDGGFDGKLLQHADAGLLPAAHGAAPAGGRDARHRRHDAGGQRIFAGRGAPGPGHHQREKLVLG